MMHKLSNDSSFIRFDERSQKYTLHNIFASYLRGLLEKQADQTEVLGLYRRCGQWRSLNDDNAFGTGVCRTEGIFGRRLQKGYLICAKPNNYI